MNYMDYTNNACMNLFTNGQKIRMRANFAPGGFRDYFQYQTISSYINGNDAVCPTAATYSINGLPTGAGNFNWEVGPRLEIVSGANTNNPQIKAKLSSHRDDWIIGSFTAGCYGRIYVRKEVYTNTPYPNYITSDPVPSNGFYCTGTFYQFSAMFNDWDQANLVDSYQWSVSPNTFNNASTTWTFLAAFSAPGNYTITVRAMGECGLSAPAEIHCQAKRCSGIGINYVIAPNPANTVMTVMFGKPNPGFKGSDPTTTSGKRLTVTLYDNMFNVRRTTETTIGNNITFNTSDLEDGIYYLQISDGNYIDQQPVLITH